MTHLLEFLPREEAVLVEIKSFEGILHSVSGVASLHVRGELRFLLVRGGHTTQQTILKQNILQHFTSELPIPEKYYSLHSDIIHMFENDYYLCYQM